MSDQENMAIARNFLETAWNKRDLSIVDKLVAANHASHGPFTDQLPAGKEGVRAFTSTFLSAFPDVHCHIDHQEADGDLVKTTETFTGTQTGELMGMPATGRRATVVVEQTDRISGGKIVETWTEWDVDDFMNQLGLSEAGAGS